MQAGAGGGGGRESAQAWWAGGTGCKYPVPSSAFRGTHRPAGICSKFLLHKSNLRHSQTGETRIQYQHTSARKNVRKVSNLPSKFCLDSDSDNRKTKGLHSGTWSGLSVENPPVCTLGNLKFFRVKLFVNSVKSNITVRSETS